MSSSLFPERRGKTGLGYGKCSQASPCLLKPDMLNVHESQGVKEGGSRPTYALWGKIPASVGMEHRVDRIWPFAGSGEGEKI